MKNSRKMFILIEGILAALVIIMASIMLWERNEGDTDRISVIIRNSDDNQWAAFKYGLRMAAEDQGIEMFVVSTGDMLTVEEQKRLIEDEISKGADAIIVQPVPGTDTEEILKKIEKKIPVMLVEHTASENREASLFPITQPDNYAMGRDLAEELLKDYSGKLEGKTLGILSNTADSEDKMNRESGFRDALDNKGAEVAWSVSDFMKKTEEDFLAAQPKVDFVIALDDASLTAAGETSAAKNLHGALVYGIGNSTEAVYYLDTGIVECLVVPDEFNVGYQSLTEVAECLSHYFYKQQDRTVSHAVIRRNELFSKENQEIIFTMSQ